MALGFYLLLFFQHLVLNLGDTSASFERKGRESSTTSRGNWYTTRSTIVTHKLTKRKPSLRLEVSLSSSYRNYLSRETNSQKANVSHSVIVCEMDCNDEKRTKVLPDKGVDVPIPLLEVTGCKMKMKYEVGSHLDPTYSPSIHFIPPGKPPTAS